MKNKREVIAPYAAGPRTQRWTNALEILCYAVAVLITLAAVASLLFQ